MKQCLDTSVFPTKRWPREIRIYNVYGNTFVSGTCIDFEYFDTYMQCTTIGLLSVCFWLVPTISMSSNSASLELGSGDSGAHLWNWNCRTTFGTACGCMNINSIDRNMCYTSVVITHRMDMQTFRYCYTYNWGKKSWRTYVTGEKLWLDRGSNAGPFADRANTLPLSYRATRSSHQQLFTWTLPGYT